MLSDEIVHFIKEIFISIVTY